MNWLLQKFDRSMSARKTPCIVIVAVMTKGKQRSLIEALVRF